MKQRFSNEGGMTRNPSLAVHCPGGPLGVSFSKLRSPGSEIYFAIDVDHCEFFHDLFSSGLLLIDQDANLNARGGYYQCSAGLCLLEQGRSVAHLLSQDAFFVRSCLIRHLTEPSTQCQHYVPYLKAKPLLQRDRS